MMQRLRYCNYLSMLQWMRGNFLHSVLVGMSCIIFNFLQCNLHLKGFKVCKFEDFIKRFIYYKIRRIKSIDFKTFWSKKHVLIAKENRAKT